MAKTVRIMGLPGRVDRSDDKLPPGTTSSGGISPLNLNTNPNEILGLIWPANGA